MFQHTPYDGSKFPFTIGLEPLADRPFIEPDGSLEAHLERKAELFTADLDQVFQAEPGSLAAQHEVLDLVLGHLKEVHPDRYRIDGSKIDIGPGWREILLEDGEPPLLQASRLVQEDLVLMQKGEGGYRLTAASLCFPSSWLLTEKFGKPMAEIHAPVPGFAGRMATIIDRIFDNLQSGQPVLRFNWSIYDDADLHHPEGHQLALSPASGEAALAGLFLRVERQTLTRLETPDSILFTIKIHHDPLNLLGKDPRRRELAEGLRRQLMDLNADQLRYKGLESAREWVSAALRDLECR